MEQTKKSIAPFMRHENSLRSMMLDMCIALSPALIWGFYVFGTRSIVITLLSIFFFVGFEILFRFVFKTGLLFHDHSEIVSALIFAMLLPAGTPLWIIPIGALLATGFAKGLLSAFGKCFLNPTLFAKAVLLLIFPKQMTLFTQPFAELPPFQISLSKESLEPILTQNPLAALKSEDFVPPSFSDLITGSLAGNVGEVSALLLLAGFLYLLVRGVISWRIPLSFMGSAFLFSFFNSVGDAPFSFALSSLLCGGILFGAIFLATDPPSSPVTRSGMVLYGILCGGLTVLFRSFGDGVQGMVFAVLIANLLSRPLDFLFRPRPYGEKGFFATFPSDMKVVWEKAKLLWKKIKALWKLLLEKIPPLLEKIKKKNK